MYIIHGDSIEILSGMSDNSIDLVLTDPPYFLEKLSNTWDAKEVGSKKYQSAVTSLPAGMKFDRKQGVDFYEWYLKVSKEILRVVKPGGFFFSFSSPRLYHRMTCAMDDVGFMIKDQFLWIYTQNQPKAMSLDHFVNKREWENKSEIAEKIDGWKTPQIKSCFEPIAVGQKPYEDTMLDNFLKYGVGLFNTKVKIGNNKFPSNLFTSEEMNETFDSFFLIDKPKKSEKGDFNTHKTVKPIAVCKYLIELATKEGALVLDPFCGSGTTLVAAKALSRDYIGIDINEEYIEICKKRLNDENNCT